MTEINLGAGFQDVVESVGKPALEDGTYLAVVLAVEPYEKDKDDGSKTYSLLWNLLINSNPESITDGWDSAARLIPYKKHYTFVGYKRGGKLEVSPYARSTAQILGALDATAKFNTSDVVGKLVKVVVGHEPSYQDKQLLDVDPDHKVEQYVLRVRFVNPYVVDGVKAPMLKTFDYDDVETEAPATEDEF